MGICEAMPPRSPKPRIRQRQVPSPQGERQSPLPLSPWVSGHRLGTREQGPVPNDLEDSRVQTLTGRGGQRSPGETAAPPAPGCCHPVCCGGLEPGFWHELLTLKGSQSPLSSTPEAEAGGLQVQAQPGQLSDSGGHWLCSTLSNPLSPDPILRDGTVPA